MTRDEQIDRAHRAREARDGFLAPAMAEIRAEYIAALTMLAANEPWETGKITKLAVAIKVIDKVDEQLSAIIAGGTVAEHAQARAEQIARIPETKRKMLQRMGMVA